MEIYRVDVEACRLRYKVLQGFARNHENFPRTAVDENQDPSCFVKIKMDPGFRRDDGLLWFSRVRQDDGLFPAFPVPDFPFPTPGS